ncbi:hypothetical protein N7516_009685 [Penicillium verrucosum]|uniref:uncharacterized protein n=1 Tax=Penicillium verrucosum TaxID=60171 RepID=UPI002545759B|nr:uncharacterized protein N7516_009685 [Penicillium verrucosum]KAJ5921982.1 hypothetical protein N7516_009685 [Penicillium verrucosum]
MVGTGVWSVLLCYSLIWLRPEKTALLLGIRGSLAHGFEITTRLGDVLMRMYGDKQAEAKLPPLIPSGEENLYDI